ncbi:NADH-quinone oxidoreductase subunit C [Streptomyces sp. NPDC047046]|uniref:hydrogenase large subunit n=1 Tax=Streptomyces sp. NPDC047046 TaxID=3155378 RepID=UPI0033E1C836
MPSTPPYLDLADWRDHVLSSAEPGGTARFAGLFGDADGEGGILLTAVLFPPSAGEPELLHTYLAPGQLRYAALSPDLPAAFWYERALHDLFGTRPEGHPRLDPLLLPLSDPARAPLPGVTAAPPPLGPDEKAVPRATTGPGVFTFPHGPVRSGVFESIQYLLETPGEDILRLQIRPFYKHRGVSKRFEGCGLDDAVLVAERAEGISSVAHALALTGAIERCAGVQAPWAARLVRTQQAELERVANHLDVMLKLTDAAGLAVATSRFGLHKERLLRLRGALCGSRYGRGVVVPGGVQALPRLDPAQTQRQLNALEETIAGDWKAALSTPSFLDRLRTTGVLLPALAIPHGALGPVGKASGSAVDARYDRPYDAYTALGLGELPVHTKGDVLARTEVRGHEITQSFRLLRQIAEELRSLPDDPDLRNQLPERVSGETTGWAESAQGEVLYLVRLEEGRVARCVPRSASFHNLVLLHEVFGTDILTDFPFIEASFGVSMAGVAI